jgi:hypothetical protein
MIVSSAWPQVMDYFGTRLVIEPWRGQVSRDAGLLPLRSSTSALGSPGPSLQALDDPRGADLTRVQLSRASA